MKKSILLPIVLFMVWLGDTLFKCGFHYNIWNKLMIWSCDLQYYAGLKSPWIDPNNGKTGV